MTATAEKITVTTTVDEEWIEYGLKHCDLFHFHCIGYWACGVERDDQLGWLVREEYEVDDDGPDEDEVIALWRDGAELPAGYHRLDRAAMVRAFSEGVKHYGAAWYTDGKSDADTYDHVVQLALLDEWKYG